MTTKRRENVPLHERDRVDDALEFLAATSKYLFDVPRGACTDDDVGDRGSLKFKDATQIERNEDIEPHPINVRCHVLTRPATYVDQRRPAAADLELVTSPRRRRRPTNLRCRVYN